MFILAGAALAIVAQRRACKTLERLESHSLVAASSPNFKALAYSVALGAIVLVAGLWILNDKVI